MPNKILKIRRNHKLVKINNKKKKKGRAAEVVSLLESFLLP